MIKKIFILLFINCFIFTKIHSQNFIKDDFSKKQLKYAVQGKIPCAPYEESLGVYNPLGHYGNISFTWDLGYVDTTIICCTDLGFHHFTFKDSTGKVYSFDFDYSLDSNGVDTVFVCCVGPGIYRYALNGFNSPNYFDISYVDPIRIIDSYIYPPTCFGDTNGIIAPLPIGGTEPYKYYWEKIEGSDIDTFELTQYNLKKGKYRLYVNDIYNCGDSLSTINYDLKEPDKLIASPIISQPICNGDMSGSISIFAIGGNKENNYNYEWQTNSTSILQPNVASQTNLRKGNYYITVMDYKGCNDSVSVSIIEPDKLQIINSTKNDLVCNNDNSGFISIKSSGGNGNNRYLWTSNTNSNLISDSLKQYHLAAGNYTVIVKDFKSCADTSSFTLTQPEALLINPTITNPLCYNDSNAIIITNPSGGNGGYVYSWQKIMGSSVNPNSPNQFNLKKGLYSIQVKDSKNCIEDSVILITEPQKLNVVELLKSLPNCYTKNDGKLFLTIIGGTPNYLYTWYTSNGKGINNSELNQSTLDSGTYTLYYKDLNNCNDSVSYNFGYRPVSAGEDTTFYLCSITQSYDLNNALTNADLVGKWYYGTTEIAQGIIKPSAYADQTTFTYKIDAIPECNTSKSEITLLIENMQNAGEDRTVSICNDYPYDLNLTLETISSQGYWFDDDQTNQLQNTTFTPGKLNGLYHFTYKINEHNSCPADSSLLTIVTDTIRPKAVCKSTLIIESNILSDYYYVNDKSLDIEVIDNCEYTITNSLNNSNTLEGENVKNGEIITWYVTDLAGNTGVCISTLEYSFKMPNLFTPNGDGYNDTWYFDLGIEYPNALVIVYNRWGQKVFISDNGYKTKWNGISLNGEKAEDGSYQFIITNNDKYLFKGSVTILR